MTLRGKRNGMSGFAERRAISSIDKLAEFEEFERTILPAIRKDLKSGLSAKQIRAKYASLVQASVVSTALADADSGKRLAAAKDILDRDEGKARERSTVTHKFNDMTDIELESLLQSELKEIELTPDDYKSSDRSKDSK